MRWTILKKSYVLAFIVAGLFVTPVLADKPSWAGGGKGGKHGKAESRESRSRYDQPREVGKSYPGGGEDSRDVHFDDRQRTVIHDYYAEQFRAGNCPPGLAKKDNGCMPPGQAKKWAIGRPLPSNVIYYDLPPAVAVQIGLPLPGYRYVRVANDILLMAIGTGMIVDAITDLGGL